MTRAAHLFIGTLCILAAVVLTPWSLAGNHFCAELLSPAQNDIALATNEIGQLESIPAPLPDLSRPIEEVLGSELETGGKIWRRWMSRDDGSKSNLVYLANAKISLKIFDQWFRNGNLGQFQKMLKKMHESAALGDIQHPTTYTTVSIGNDSYSSGNVLPGLFRFEYKAMSNREIVDHFRKANKNAFKFHNYDQNLLQSKGAARAVSWRYTMFHPDISMGIGVDWKVFLKQKPSSLQIAYGDRSIIVPLSWNATGVKAAEDPYWLVELSGITDKRYLPRNSIRSEDKVFFHEAPDDEHLSMYLDRAAQIMEKLRGMELSLGEKEKATFLEYLSDYSHLMINTHPFYRLNNSIIMNQVNYVLRIHGFRPIAHGNLDLVASVVSYKQFRALFGETVMKFQAID